MDDQPQPGELAPSGIDAGPSARNVGRGLLAAWLLLQIALPMRYYLSDDVYDERFAWRMFSAVRVQECQLGAMETTSGLTHPIPLSGILPAPWISLLQRNRPAVIRRFLDWRCRSEAAPSVVELTHTCRSAGGEMLAPIARRLDCETHAYTESGDE